MNKRKPIPIGTVINDLTVIEELKERTRGGCVTYLCQCECGETKRMTAYELAKAESGTYCTHKRVEKTHERITNSFIYETSVAQLKSKKQPSESGCIGVYYNYGIKMWRAYIKFRKKRYHLGSYHNIEDAITARKAAEQMTHEAFLEWFEIHKNNLDDAPLPPDGSGLEALIEKRKEQR